MSDYLIALAAICVYQAMWTAAGVAFLIGREWTTCACGRRRIIRRRDNLRF